MPSAALPLQWVDRIFTKLTLVYGRDFLARWEGLSIDAVKADWAAELAGLQHRPEAIKHALDCMSSGKPPTVREFRDLTRRAPVQAADALPAPQASPEVVQQAVSRAHAAPRTDYDHKAWARRIMREHESGAKLNPTRLRFAREALRLDVHGSFPPPHR